MLTLLGSGFKSASPGQLALAIALAVLFGALGYRMSARHRALRGVTPWRLPSFAWAAICFVLQFVGLAIEVVAELTTRAPYSPATPASTPTAPGAPPSAASAPASRYAPPTSPPVVVDAPATAGAGASGETGAAPTGEGETARSWPRPPVDATGRPAPFGWYADPGGRHGLRYFDGRQWSEHVVDGDRLAVDPL